MKVFELDISEKIKPIPFVEGYDQYYTLIKFQRHPLGWLYFKRTESDVISTEELEQLIKDRLGYSIVRQMLAHAIDVKPKSIVQPQAISIVVCTRNRTAYLANCLKALMELEYSNYEIIVVDNAPGTEETREFVATVPVRYVREDKPGLDWARNRGIAEATHNIIAFTDDDAVVDKYWLQVISKAFNNDEVMCVTGFVAPAELETGAQRMFELNYGGMAHGFRQRIFKKEQLSNRQLIWASNFGVGANMSFRKKIFEQIGNFDVALDVGTPSCGGGDIEMFHRVVAKGYHLLYEPSMLVWHTHRKHYGELKKQISDNGKSFGCYLITCYKNKTVGAGSLLKFSLVDWLYRWNLKNLFKASTKIPRYLTVRELFGMASSPIAYARSQRRAKQMINQKEQ